MAITSRNFPSQDYYRDELWKVRVQSEHRTAKCFSKTWGFVADLDPAFQKTYHSDPIPAGQSFLPPIPSASHAATSCPCPSTITHDASKQQPRVHFPEITGNFPQTTSRFLGKCSTVNPEDGPFRSVFQARRRCNLRLT